MLTWLNCFTPARFGVDDDTSNIRSGYERDYDRILFSSAFRRLQNKTQVFPLPEHVFVHNRLTHSLEVVSVGRSLGKMVGEQLAKLPAIRNEDEAVYFYQNELKNVVAAACLAHDLGNPAFGHSGEEAISKYFRDKEADSTFKARFTAEQWQDLTHFEGNANALRLLTRQYKGRLKGGYRLTYPSLASILKYPCESTAVISKKPRPKHRSKYGFFQSDKDTFLEIAVKLNMVKEGDAPLSYLRHPFVYLVEAADDICYSIIDFEDAHRIGILSFEEVKTAFMHLIVKNKNEDIDRLHSNLKNLSNDPNEAVAYLRAKAINFLVNQCSEAFIQQHEAILKGNFKGSLLSEIAELQEPLAYISEQSVNRIYNHNSVVKIELAGFKIMSGLIEDLVEATFSKTGENRHQKLLKLMPLQYQFAHDDSDYEKIMCILDYVSGMTDNYALELYRNLRGISVPKI